jgi:hypothetical protein
MQVDTKISNAIKVNLRTLDRLLFEASHKTLVACDQIGRGEQNTAIGTLLHMDELLEQATALYRATVAIHRCYRR